MDFISNQKTQIDEMLGVLGKRNIEELFEAIPKSLVLPRPSEDDGLSEYEGMQKIKRLSEKSTYHTFESYLGFGAYEHHIPQIVPSLLQKSELLTSYTPYQAEASQGILQILFEFQSIISRLTGLKISNASLYDGASACAEACLMALRHKSPRQTILLSKNIHPHTKAVIRLYLNGCGAKIKEFHDNPSLDQDTAAVVLQSPNVFGCFEDVEPISRLVKEQGALTILSSNPITYGLFRSAKELGVDIAVGDLQPLGMPLNFGGPFAGYLACQKELLRQLPGRLVGETIDSKGRRGYVLTLQTREQHIRREKATSNICTSQTLCAAAFLITLLWYGEKGLKKLALTNFQRTAYLKQGLQAIQGITIQGKGHFNEFLAIFTLPVEKILSHFRAQGIEPGLPFSNGLLIAVTETKSKEQLDRFIYTAKKLF